MPYADREREREYQFGRSSPDTPFDRSSGYLNAEQRRIFGQQVCEDIRARFAAKGWDTLGTTDLRQKILKECRQWN